MESSTPSSSEGRIAEQCFIFIPLPLVVCITSLHLTPWPLLSLWDMLRQVLAVKLQWVQKRFASFTAPQLRCRHL